MSGCDMLMLDKYTVRSARNSMESYMTEPRILPAGDRALVVEFGDAIDEAINERVQALAGALARSRIRGVTEVVPTFRSMMVCYEPERISYRRLSARIRRMDARPRGPEGGSRRVLRVPCLYEGEDLADMERITGLPRDEIVAIHSATDYRIYMLGFLPGFVYLGGMDGRIAAPRLATPRKAIPAGSVGIGGDQTGVYPLSSPGGWRLIGITPLRFYDPEREQPILCRAGEYIRFCPISRAEYDDIAARVAAGSYAPEYRETGGAAQ